MAGGHAIPNKVEHEQAFILHRLIGFWAEHGSGWREALAADLKALKMPGKDIFDD